MDQSKMPIIKRNKLWKSPKLNNVIHTVTLSHGCCGNPVLDIKDQSWRNGEVELRLGLDLSCLDRPFFQCLAGKIYKALIFVVTRWVSNTQNLQMYQGLPGINLPI